MAIPAGTMLKRGLLRRCPVCGQGRLFRRWTKMVARCPRCAYRFHRAPGQWLGSWFLNVCTVQTVLVVVMLAITGITWPQTPGALLFLAGLITATVTPFVLFPFSRTLWVAIDLIMKPLDFEDDVAPGFELERELAALGSEGDDRGPIPPSES